jgi:N-acetylneuraminic acid mutarotase
VLLDGSSSHDDDGHIVKYKWTQVNAALSALIARPDSATTIVKALTVGVYSFQLQVTDDNGGSAKDTVQITVSNSTGVNHPPVANAGRDTTAMLPVNSMALNGSSSYDPDGTILSYQWTKIAGSSSSVIISPKSAQTQVTNFIEDVYRFELMVTDNGGLSSKDTVQVTLNPATSSACDNSNRPTINAQLVPVGTLSQPRVAMSVASAGNKIVFAGGDTISNGYYDKTTRVDIYDISTNTSTTAELSKSRDNIAATANGNKVFFAGGEAGDGTFPVDNVDIYDVSTNKWTANNLSSAGNGIAAAAVGNKVLFAGGDGGFTGGWRRSITVDIYNLSTDTWTIAPLASEAKRGGRAGVTLNGKVYFAGGESWSFSSTQGTWYFTNRIDIYDDATNTWSAGFLNQRKWGLAAIAVNDKIYWAGGQTGSNPSISPTCTVEINDVNTNTSSIQYLSQPSEYSYAIIKDNKILVFSSGYNSTNNKFDIYDVTTNSWSIGVLPFNIRGATIISVNNTVYLAGGEVNGHLSGKVYKLEF